MTPNIKTLLRVILWIATIAATLFLGLAGVAKFLDPAAWSARFVAWGYPGAFSMVVGGGEILGAALLPFRKTALAAGLLLVVIMIGALATVLVHHAKLGPQAPLINLGLLGVVLALRWQERRRQAAESPIA